MNEGGETWIEKGVDIDSTDESGIDVCCFWLYSCLVFELILFHLFFMLRCC